MEVSSSANRLVVFVVFLLIILSLRFYYFYTNLDLPEVGDVVVLEHTFLRDGRIGEYSQTFRVGEITVYVPLYPRYLYGDVVEVGGVVELQEIEIEGEAPIVRLVVKEPVVRRLDTPWYLSFVTGIRARIVRVFQHYLPPDQAALLLGIVFGVREGISEELNEVFRSTGVLHVVAASGANIALVGGFCMLFFDGIGSRRFQVILVMGCIGFYALLSGGEVSIVRASLMAGFAYSGGILGRQYSALFGLSFAAYVLLFINPLIWSDVGFLLSLTSTLGIILMQVPLHKVFSLGRSFLPIEDFSTSISATLGTVPVLLFFFLSYPVLSVFINMLVLWTVPYLMILGGVGALFALISDVMAAPFLYLSLPLLSYFLWIVKIFPQDMNITVHDFSAYFVLAYYCFFFAVILLLRKRAL